MRHIELHLLTPRARDDTRPADHPVGRTLAGRYRIEAPIGAGGFGTVYRATHLALDRTVAIKLVGRRTDPRALDRFRREARAQARIGHPVCVTVHDIDADPQLGAFLVMEHVDGRSLAALMAERGPFAPAVAAAITARLLDGLAAAHRARIVHRDVKPANVVLAGGRAEPEAVRLVDFGIARLLDADATAMTRPGALLGTPRYIAPEQARGEAVSARTDVYAVGVMLHELLTGRPPFVAADAFSLAVQHITAPPPPLPPEVDPRLGAIVERALAKHPADRFASADEMARALRALDDPPAPPPRRRAARAGWALLALAPLAIVVGAHGGSDVAEHAPSEARAASPAPPAAPIAPSRASAPAPRSDAPSVAQPAAAPPPAMTRRRAAVIPPDDTVRQEPDPEHRRSESVDDLIRALHSAARDCQCRNAEKLYSALKIVDLAEASNARRLAEFYERCRARLGGCPVSAAPGSNTQAVPARIEPAEPSEPPRAEP